MANGNSRSDRRRNPENLPQSAARMVVPVIFLALAILLARLSAACLESTISDCYFTTAHPDFIGAICALGTCVIVYQGSSATEDALLNFAGFLAFVVALVPTPRPRLVNKLRVTESRSLNGSKRSKQSTS